MIDPRQFRYRVLRPTLSQLHPLVPYSIAAENLLLGTALVESRLTFLRQRVRGPVGSGFVDGPARGVFQVEPRTHDDVWETYLAFKPDLASVVRSLASQRFPGPGNELRHLELEVNLAYAAAIARLKYRRSPALLPAANDYVQMAMIHKAVYNTAGGETDVTESAKVFKQVVAGGEYADR